MTYNISEKNTNDVELFILIFELINRMSSTVYWTFRELLVI